jgi:hypothetical protein
MIAGYRLIGYACRVRTDLPDVGRLVRELLAAFEVPGVDGPEYRLERDSDPAEPNPFRLSVDGREAHRVATWLGLVDELLWEVNRAAIPTAPGVAVHAGAVSLAGSGIVLPAPMDSGKTTLTAGLVVAGCSYLTDEAALIAPETGELLAYPKPLWLSPGSIGAIDGLRDRVMPEYRELGRMRTYVRPSDLRPGALGGPCRIALVVAPRFLAASPVRLDPMSRAATLMCLAENSFNLRELGGVGLEQLRRSAAGARGYRLTHGDLDGAVAAILELLR